MVERNRGERSRVDRICHILRLSNMGGGTASAGHWPDPLSGIRTTPEMGMMTPESRGRHPAGSRPQTSRNGLELLALQADALEPLLELGELAAGVDQAMHAGPGRVRLGVDVQTDG